MRPAYVFRLAAAVLVSLGASGCGQQTTETETVTATVTATETVEAAAPPTAAEVSKALGCTVALGSPTDISQQDYSAGIVGSLYGCTDGTSGGYTSMVILDSAGDLATYAAIVNQLTIDRGLDRQVAVGENWLVFGQNPRVFAAAVNFGGELQAA